MADGSVPMARIGFHAWMFNADYEPALTVAAALRGEGARPDVPQADPEWPMSHLMIKCFESLRSMSDYDPHPAAVSSPEKAAWLQSTIYAPQSISLVGWGVSHGDNTALATAEGKVMGSYARVLGGIGMLDLETRDQFGNYWHPYPTGPWDLLTAAKIECEKDGGPPFSFWANADWRQGHEAATQLDDFLKAVEDLGLWDGFRPVLQTYPELFYPDQTPGRSRVRRAIDAAISPLRFRSFPMNKIMISLSGDCPPDEWAEAITYMKELGIPWISCWRRGITRPDVINWLKALPDSELPHHSVFPTPPLPIPPDPEPEPEPPTGSILTPTEVEMLQHARQASAVSTAAVSSVLLAHGVPDS